MPPSQQRASPDIGTLVVGWILPNSRQRPPQLLVAPTSGQRPAMTHELSGGIFGKYPDRSTCRLQSKGASLSTILTWASQSSPIHKLFCGAAHSTFSCDHNTSRRWDKGDKTFVISSSRCSSNNLSLVACSLTAWLHLIPQKA